MRSFKIGNVLIPGNLILGPMAGVTDLPFRLLCKEQGADLVYTEMISAITKIQKSYGKSRMKSIRQHCSCLAQIRI